MHSITGRQSEQLVRAIARTLRRTKLVGRKANVARIASSFTNGSPSSSQQFFFLWSKIRFFIGLFVTICLVAFLVMQYSVIFFD